MQQDNAIKYALSFLLGVIAGAVVALLFAPTSGNELRANIKTQADAQYAKLQDDYQKGMQQVHTSLDKMNTELQTLSSRLKDTGKST